MLLESQHLLLQTASPDAIVRLKLNESLSKGCKEIQSKYFKHMHCPSLLHYLIHRVHGYDKKDHMMQVSILIQTNAMSSVAYPEGDYEIFKTALFNVVSTIMYEMLLG